MFVPGRIQLVSAQLPQRQQLNGGAGRGDAHIVRSAGGCAAGWLAFELFAVDKLRMRHPYGEIPELARLEAADGLIRIPDQQDVPFTPRVRALVDTAEFQRLSQISQLALTSRVYPGATNTRFEHALGVFHNSLRYLWQLGRDPRFAAVVDTHLAEVLMVAALLHDIGHWPFCHPIEDMDLPGLRAHESFAAELLGVAGVRLYHDQALFKEPGGGPTPWHQDQVYWPLATDRTVTLWMPLVDLPPEVGSMRFVSGSHRMGDLGGSAIGDESHAFFEALIAERGLRVESHGALRAGDATFHAGWTVHSAGPNPTNRMRSVMTIIYVADGTRVSKIANAARALDQKAWLGGRKPGERVEGELNPRLWPPG